MGNSTTLKSEDLTQLQPAWRMGPHDLDIWLITMVSFSPLSRVVARLGW